jgi:CBS domain-containing protein
MSTHDSLSRRVDTVGQITVNRPMLTFRTDDRVEHIVREMIKHHQGAVGITGKNDAGKLKGLMTERDILRKIFGTHEETQAQFDARNHHLDVYPRALLARDVMTHNPLCLTEDMPVGDALEIIKRHGYRYMPVVKSGNKDHLVGLVSERELFWHTQEKMRRTIDNQISLLQYFISEPYGCNSVPTQLSN